jgi:hypothetical protein
LSGNYDISGAALDALSYFNYRQVRQKSYNLLELGDTSSAPTQLLPSGGALTNGVRLDKNEKVAGVGKFEYRGRTDPDTEIDVYINGFLEEINMSLVVTKYLFIYFYRTVLKINLM